MQVRVLPGSFQNIVRQGDRVGPCQRWSVAENWQTLLHVVTFVDVPVRIRADQLYCLYLETEMSRATCGGPVVKSYDGFFLRDDSPIRRNAGMEPVEAYSLFRDEPYGRIEVLAGPREWAILLADGIVYGITTSEGK